MAILVVEDEFLIRDLLVLNLSEVGFEVIPTANADEAIDILSRRSDISHVITDIDMPGTMDGLRLAHAVRGRWPPIKIVVCSGKHRPSAGQLPTGSTFVAKPFVARNITDAIEGLRDFVG